MGPAGRGAAGGEKRDVEKRDVEKREEKEEQPAAASARAASPRRQSAAERSAKSRCRCRAGSAAADEERAGAAQGTAARRTRTRRRRRARQQTRRSVAALAWAALLLVLCSLVAIKCEPTEQGLAAPETTAEASRDLQDDVYTYYDGSGDGAPACEQDVAMDVVFVLGSWEAWSDASWDSVRAFAADFVQNLAIGADDTSSRASVVTFATTAEKVVRFDSSTATNASELDASLRTLSRSSSSSRWNAATRYSYVWSGIQNAHDLIRFQARATAQPVVIFISDGMPAINNSGPDDSDWSGCTWPVEDWPGEPGAWPTGNDRAILCSRGEAERIQDQGGFFAYVQLAFEGANGISRPLSDELSQTLFKRDAAPFQDPSHPYSGIGASTASEEYLRLSRQISDLNSDFATTLYEQILYRVCPSIAPTDRVGVENPTSSPTRSPTRSPTVKTAYPTRAPTPYPTKPITPRPTQSPTKATPTMKPTMSPTLVPTRAPSDAPTSFPTTAPTRYPSLAPTRYPSLAPTNQPTRSPSIVPITPTTPAPTSLTPSPSPLASTSAPSGAPSAAPSEACILYDTQYALDEANILRAPVVVESVDGCQVICQLSSSCLYFSWNAVNDTCYLKNELPGTGDLIAASDYVSGPKYCNNVTPSPTAAGGSDCLVSSYQYPLDEDNLFSDPTAGIESAESCQEFCRWQPNCEYFTFSVEDDLCYLKDTAPEDASAVLIAADGYISGPPKCTVPNEQANVSTSDKVLDFLRGLIKSPYLWIGIGFALLLLVGIALREYNLRGQDPNSGAIYLRSNPAFGGMHSGSEPVHLRNQSLSAISDPDMPSLGDSAEEEEDDSGSLFTEPSAWTRH